MASDAVVVEAVNIEELRQALAQAPDIAFKFIGSEMKRFAARFKKKFIRERLRGRPGIKWDEGKLKIGRNVRAFTKGKGLSDLEVQGRISSFLRSHEEGATLTPQRGDMLAIRLRPGLPEKPQGVENLFYIPTLRALAIKDEQGVRLLYALRPSVRIPARLGFVAMWNQEMPALQKRIGDAAGRALKVSMDRQMKRTVGLVQQVANL